jgi:hypothetical protein
MMRNKLIIALLLMALAAQFAPAPSAFAAVAADEVLFNTQVNAGYWDIWLHADGTTWQHTGKPGDVKEYAFEVASPAQAEKYENVRYEMMAGITKEQFMQAGGWNNYKPNEGYWEEFKKDFLTHIPDNYRKSGENQVTFMLSPKTKAEYLKEEDWQSELVEGWRWYLPATFYWYGTPKDALPDFQAVDLQAGTKETEPGETYTGNVTYKLKDTAKEPTEAVLVLTHNGYPLSTPGGEALDGQWLVFNPGESKEFEFKWTGQDTDSTFKAEIWPVEPADQPRASRDAYPEDNVLEVTVPRAGYKLTMLMTGKGKTTPPQGVHLYPAGEKVALSAKPDTGWKFVCWQGDITGTNPNAQVVMDADKKVRAVFEKNSHTLTIKVSPSVGGTTNPVPGVHTYDHGTNVNVRAIAGEYWEFSHWSANAEGTNPNINVLMDWDKVVVAHFKQNILEPSDPGDPGGVGPPMLVK